MGTKKVCVLTSGPGRKSRFQTVRARFSCLISLSGRYHATLVSKLFMVRTVTMRVYVVFTPAVIQVTSVLLSNTFMGLIPSKLLFKPKTHKIGLFQWMQLLAFCIPSENAVGAFKVLHHRCYIPGWNTIYLHDKLGRGLCNLGRHRCLH